MTSSGVFGPCSLPCLALPLIPRRILSHDSCVNVKPWQQLVSSTQRWSPHPSNCESSLLSLLDWYLFFAIALQHSPDFFKNLCLSDNCLLLTIFEEINLCVKQCMPNYLQCFLLALNKDSQMAVPSFWTRDLWTISSSLILDEELLALLPLWAYSFRSYCLTLQQYYRLIY